MSNDEILHMSKVEILDYIKNSYQDYDKIILKMNKDFRDDYDV